MKIALMTTLPGLIENQRFKEEARKMGYQFKIVNLKDFNFLIDREGLKAKNLTDLKADLVIIRGIFSSLKTIAFLVSQLKKQGIKVFDNNFLKHRYSIDKVTDLVKLASNNLPVPMSAYTRDFKDYFRLAKKIGYPLVVKSTRMGKGAHVFKLDQKKDLADFINQCQEEGRAAKNFLLQEYIPYLDDLRILIIGQRMFTMRRIPAEGEFRANFSLGGRVEVFKLNKATRELALKALKAIGMTIGGVDLLLTKDKKPFLLEVNHTAGFVGMEKATGINIGKLFLEHAFNNVG